MGVAVWSENSPVQFVRAGSFFGPTNGDFRKGGRFGREGEREGYAGSSRQDFRTFGQKIAMTNTVQVF